MASESVKVAVRVRPFNQREKNAKSKCIISVSGNTTCITNPANNEQKNFAFDHSYWSHDGYREKENGVLEAADSNYATQQAVFNDLGQGVLENAWQGYNAALFAYGQTGSGKSYSMIGYGPNKGIVPITCGQLFQAIESNSEANKEFQVTFSMLEIYNEQVRDLLCQAKTQQPGGGLRVRQHPQSGFYVEGLKSVPTESYAQIETLMDQGTINRTTASTNMNATSSRSHMVITITFKQIYKNDSGESTTKSSRISLVDLAGSERATSSGATGDRLKEGSAINQSLSTLGKVISALADLATGKNIMVPYRDSVLTKLLQSALGGNSKTIMIAALSPAAMNYDETLSTLRYADRAKSIKNQAVINENPTDKLIRELKEEKQKLMKQLKELSAGGAAGKIDELEHLLEQNKKEWEDMQLSWEQRLSEARTQTSGTIQTPREQAMWRHLPYLQNVNEDPSLSGVVKICLEEGKTILGKRIKNKNNRDHAVEIVGLNIQQKHLVVESTANAVFITPGSETTEVLVNGKIIKSRTELKHLDRLKLGSNTLYIFAGFSKSRSPNDNPQQYDYDYFQSELADQAGMGHQMMRSVSQDQGFSVDPDTVVVFQEYANVTSKVKEVNYMSEEMGKGVLFEGEIQNLAAHDDRGKPRQKDIGIRVTNKYTNKVWMWSQEKFINRKYMIEDMYSSWMEGGSTDIEYSKDPFSDPCDDIFLGSCHVWLNNVAYCLDSDEYLDVRNHNGREVAQLHVKLMPCDKKGNVFKDEAMVVDPGQLRGHSLDFMLQLPKARDIRWIKGDQTRGVYFSFGFYDCPDVMRTPAVCGHVNAILGFTKHLSVPLVGDDFLEYLHSHAIVVEMWGTQESDVESSYSGSDNKITDIRDLQEMKELKAKLTSKEKEASRLRTERDEARRMLAKYTKDNERVSSADSRDSEAVVVHDPRPSARRMSILPRSGLAEGGSLDAEIARALKVFFKDAKVVQHQLDGVLNKADDLVKSAGRNKSLKASAGDQQVSLQQAADGLNDCVGDLKDCMMAVIRRKKEQDQQKQTNGH